VQECLNNQELFEFMFVFCVCLLCTVQSRNYKFVSCGETFSAGPLSTWQHVMNLTVIWDQKLNLISFVPLNLLDLCVALVVVMQKPGGRQWMSLLEHLTGM